MGLLSFISFCLYHDKTNAHTYCTEGPDNLGLQALSRSEPSIDVCGRYNGTDRGTDSWTDDQMDMISA